MDTCHLTHEGQAQPRAFAPRGGSRQRIEALEQVVQRIVRHPRPVVTHGQQDAAWLVNGVQYDPPA
ncbi:hypothetical protein SDC9_149138 [bioreactor metagenome]|uniref:Uncharacterized protein n=1 Tax=bioreactor metagenome TaxID=1076179 RepID=A0A645EIT1_9ZZZZ